jgi:GR25 family glycosyltransferase involved in LPS biosynthesis
MGISAERFPAVSHSVPALGCLISHLSVLKLARDRKYPYVCIFEDDFEFLVSPEDYQRIVSTIPYDMDVVMLGWYCIETVPYNETFGKVLAATTTSGYIVHQKFYNKLIETLEESVILFIKNINKYDVVSIYSIDQYWRRLQPSANWFYSVRRIGRQRPSYSDIMATNVSYDY